MGSCRRTSARDRCDVIRIGRSDTGREVQEHLLDIKYVLKEKPFTVTWSPTLALPTYNQSQIATVALHLHRCFRRLRATHDLLHHLPATNPS